MSQPQSFLARWKKVSLPNKLTVLCTFIIAVATIWYSVTAHNQLAAMQKQLNIASKALDDAEHGNVIATDQIWKAIGNINWLAKEMMNAVNQAKISSATSEQDARKALDASIAAFRTDQRAWLNLVDFHLAAEPVPGKDLTILFSIQNSGKTPAINAVSKM